MVCVHACVRECMCVCVDGQRNNNVRLITSRCFGYCVHIPICVCRCVCMCAGVLTCEGQRSLSITLHLLFRGRVSH